MINDDIRYDDGRWYAVTLGTFAGLIIDAGRDPAVCFRVIEDDEPDSSGEFIRRMEVVLVPDGQVHDTAMQCDAIHKILKGLLDNGIVK